MRSKFSFKKVLCLGLALVLVGSSIFSGGSRTSAVSGARIQISPPLQKIILNPGEHARYSYKVQNIGNAEFEYKLQVLPYAVKDYSYDDQYDIQTDYTQMSNWIKLDRTGGKLQPGEAAEVGYTINVPKDVSAGGQYAAITSEIVPNDKKDSEASGVSNIARVAHLVFAQIAGNTHESGDIKSNDVNSLFPNPPIFGTATVENSGNIHSDMVTTLQVSDVFSNKEVYSNAEKPDTRIVLPGTHRTSQVSWDDTPFFGIFNVKQTVEFMGKKSITEKVVLVCPLWLMILVGVALVAVIVWIILRIRESKKQKGNKKGEEI